MHKVILIAVSASLLALASQLGESMAQDKGLAAIKGSQSGCTKGGCGIFKNSDGGTANKKPSKPTPRPRPSTGSGGIGGGKPTYQDIH